MRRRGDTRTRTVVVMGTTQTLAWASTVYLPAVLADPVAMGLHLSRDWFFGVFSAASLLAAALSPTVSRAIDRRGGRGVLLLSSTAFAAGLALLAMASGLAGLAIAWAVLGVGMAFGLYEAAFSTLALLYGREARGAITGPTLIGGFASTIGWPATSALAHVLGWRGACLAWAVLHLLLGLPLNRFLLPQAAPHGAGRDEREVPPTGSRGVPLLAVAFGAAAFVAGAIAAHLPRLLVATGIAPAAAVTAAALVGPAQVGARLGEFSVLRRFPPLVSARLAAALHPLGAACLAVLGGTAGATALALLHGAGNGMLTIARGTVSLALFGPSGHGLRTGLLAVPARLMQAVAPFLFGLLLDRAGTGPALALSSGLSAVALGTLLVLRRPPDGNT